MGVYWDSSSKGQDKNLRKKRNHNGGRAQKTINGVLYRKRFKNLMDAKMWLELLTKEISKEESNL